MRQRRAVRHHRKCYLGNTKTTSVDLDIGPLALCVLVAWNPCDLCVCVDMQIGLDMGIGSAVRIVAPLIGGSVVASEGLFGVGLFCSSCCILMAAISGALMPEFPDVEKQTKTS